MLRWTDEDRVLWLPVASRLENVHRCWCSGEAREWGLRWELHAVGFQDAGCDGDIVLQPPAGSRVPPDLVLAGPDYLEVGAEAARKAGPAIRECVEDALMVIVSGDSQDPLCASAMPGVVARCAGGLPLVAAVVALPDFGLPAAWRRRGFKDWRVTLREIEAKADLLVVVDPDLLAASLDPDIASNRGLAPLPELAGAPSRAAEILADCAGISRTLGWSWADFRGGLRSCRTALLLRGVGDSFGEAMDAALRSAAACRPRWSWAVARVNGPGIEGCERMLADWLHAAQEGFVSRFHGDDAKLLLMAGEQGCEGGTGLEVDLLAFGSWEREDRSVGAA